MKYRSSVTTFAKAVLSEAGHWGGPPIKEFEEQRSQHSSEFRPAVEQFLAAEERTFTKEVRNAIPPRDWKEILDFIDRYHSVYGYRAVYLPWQSQRLLMPWLAAVAICALDDIGR